MAAGKVLSHLGGALYSVEVYHDTMDVTERITEINSLLIELDQQIALADVLVVDARELRDDIVLQVDAQIAVLNTFEYQSDDWNDAQDVLITIVNEGFEARNLYLIIKDQREQLVAEKVARSIELTQLSEKVLENPVLEVWCADLADGVDGRALYANNTEVDLWCLNYDAGVYLDSKYLLPPLNKEFPAITGHQYNSPESFTSEAAACMTFWNVAMEPGFATWEPIFLKGKVKRGGGGGQGGGGTCSGAGTTDRMLITVDSVVLRSMVGGNTGMRIGGGILTPRDPFEGLIVYFDPPSTFDTGDDVVIYVESIADNKFDVTGVVVGFYDHPKAAIRVNDDTCTAQQGFMLFGDHPEEPVIMQNSVTKTTNSSGYVQWTNTQDADLGDGGLVESSHERYDYSYSNKYALDTSWQSGVGECLYRMSYVPADAFWEQKFDKSTVDWYQYVAETKNQAYWEVGGVLIPAYRYEFKYDNTLPLASNVRKEIWSLAYIVNINYAAGIVEYVERHQLSIGQEQVVGYDYYEEYIKHTVGCDFSESTEVITQNHSVTQLTLYTFNFSLIFGNNHGGGMIINGTYIPKNLPNYRTDINETTQSTDTTSSFDCPSPDFRN